MPDQIVIEETPAAVEQAPITETVLKDAGLSEPEMKMAKDQGMIPKPDDKSAEKKEEPKAEAKTLPISPDELDTFEKLHDLYQSKPDIFYQLPKATRNLYHNSKGLYKKLKEEEERRKDVEGKFEFNRVNDSVSRVKLDRIKARLANPDGLTVEELQELIGIEQKIEDDKPLTKKDLEAIEATKLSKAEEEKVKANEKQAKLNEKVLAAESYAKENIKDLSAGKYANIDDVIALAQELTASKPRYAKQINDAFADDSMTEAEVVEVIFDIARLNPKWGTTAKAENNGDVEKMVKNAGKQQTSAALTGGKGSRTISLEELTPEDAAKLNQDQWNKLPRHIKDKILKSAA
jgi:hypothetical protein